MSSRSKQRNRHPLPVPTPETPSFGVWPWLIAAWAAWVVFDYGRTYPFSFYFLGNISLSSLSIPLPLLAHDAGIVLLLLAVVFAVSGLGFFIVSRMSVPWNSALERWVFSLGLGFGILAYLVLAMGALQLYSIRNIWILFAAVFLLAVWLIRSRGLSQLWQDSVSQFTELHRHSVSWWPQKFVLLVFVLVAFAMGFVPEVFYDAMVYHLGVPRWYLLEGGIKYYPALHAQFPFTRQMLNLFGLGLQGESLAKLIHWCSGPLIIASYAAMSARYSNTKTALIASLAFMSMPMVNMNLWTTGIDVGMASFALLSAYAWLNGISDKEHESRWFILAGVFSGLTFGSKYPGFLCVISLLLAYFLWSYGRERNLKQSLFPVILMGGVAFLVMLPWLLKSFILTGNPFYPYFFKIFGGKGIVVEQIVQWMGETNEGSKHTLWELLQSPWTSTFANASSLSAPGLFPLAFMGFLVWGLFKNDMRDSWYTPLVIFSFIYMAIINLITNQLRLGIPGFVILCFALGHAAGMAYEKGALFFRITLAAIVLACSFVGFDPTWAILAMSYHPWDVITGKESPESYLSYTHPGLDPYPSTVIFDYAQKNLPQGSRLLIVGDEMVSPCKIPFSATGTYNVPFIVQWAKQSKTSDEIYAFFQKEQITHMTINAQEAVRLGRAYNWFKWDPASLAIFCEFWEKHIRLVHEERVNERYFPGQILLWLCSVLPESEAARTPPPSNLVLELYEESRYPSTVPGWLEGRLQMLEAVHQRIPGNRHILDRITYLKSLQLNSKRGAL